MISSFHKYCYILFCVWTLNLYKYRDRMDKE